MYISKTLTFDLKNGRRLSYCKYGSLIGQPVLYFHGCPGSRLEASFLHSAAIEANILIFSIDRPGFGQSDYYLKHTLSTWVNDVIYLIDNLYLKKIGIIAFSGGSVYAIACASKLGQRITKINLISPYIVLPLKSKIQYMSINWQKFRTIIFRYFTFILYPSLRLISNQLRSPMKDTKKKFLKTCRNQT